MRPLKGKKKKVVKLTTILHKDEITYRAVREEGKV